MKKIFFVITALTCISLVQLACKKNKLTSSPFELTDGKALLKVNYSCPYRFNPAVIIKVNGEKVSSAITYSTPYPGGGLNTGGNSFSDYLAVAPGNDTISLVIPFLGTNRDSIVLHSGVYAMEANVYQTVHFTDTAAKTVGIITKDASIKPDSGYVQFRFVNLIPNSTTVDLYFGPTKVASNVAYKAATDTFRLPAGNSLQWSLTASDNPTILKGSRYTSASSVANQRVFTVYARGYIGLDSTDIRSPRVSFAYNK